MTFYARTQLLSSKLGALSWHHLINDYINNGEARIPDMPDEQLRLLSDRGLRDHIAAVTEYERVYCDDIWIPFFLYARDSISALSVLVEKWYTGDNPAILVDVLTGTSEQTITQRENHALWLLAEHIRRSNELRGQFTERHGAAFFAGLDETADGRAFRVEYEEFLQWSGHRGHSDRDFIFSRRNEDPSLDYRALEALLSIGNPVDPNLREVQIRQNRVGAIDELVANVRRQPGGGQSGGRQVLRRLRRPVPDDPRTTSGISSTGRPMPPNAH